MPDLPLRKTKRKALKASIYDYNLWPSEGDSPLSITSRNGLVDDEGFLKLDASLRRRYAKTNEIENYKVPDDRTVSRFTLEEKVWPLVIDQREMVIEVEPTPENIEREAEILEYFVQIHNEFASCQNPVVVEVRSPSESTVGFFIAGEVADDKLPDEEVDTIIARALLIQT
ncbi:MAG: hypothetical protein IE914_04525 [Thiotrichales bacterium]|nr:hypothetical protein [Thiotrichales bacterium]